jgi:hypothetical protein
VTGTTGAKFIYDPACPGATYWHLLTEEFDSLAAAGKAAGSRFDDFRGRFVKELMQVLAFRAAVEVTASPFVATQIAQENGTPHVFLANFKGLRSKENARQLPEQNITISFPGISGSRVRMLPFLGAVQDLKSDHRDGRVVCVIPELDKGAVVWIE